MSTTKVEVKNLSKVFGKKNQINKALDLLDQGKKKEEILDKTGATVGVSRASMNVQEGEIFVVMGLSGSGKSTLIRLLNRLIEPTEGEVLIDGENIAKMNQDDLREVRRKKISMVFQNFGLFSHRTILENTEYGLEVQGVDKKERREKAEKALDNAGLLPYKDQYPDQLSGGMQQRVGLARALANDPEILLMDEAFSALDPLIRRDMQDELIEMQKSMRKTIIFITHDLNESLRLGDRIAIMKDGEVVQIGTGEEILTEPANDYVRNFVEDVDRSRVLTAEHIMDKPMTITLGKSGPRVALQRMRSEGYSTTLVVDDQDHLKGYVELEEVEDAVQNNVRDIESILKVGVPTTSPDTLINDLYEQIYDSRTPLAVVDEDGRLEGIVVRGHVISALAKNEMEEQVNG